MVFLCENSAAYMCSVGIFQQLEWSSKSKLFFEWGVS